MPDRRERQLIVVSGAGIAGLTAALALERKGFRVLVLERQKEHSQSGAGIQLSPNAYKVLQKLGLTQALIGESQRPQSILIKSGLTGEALNEFSLGETIFQRHDAPYLVLHRSDLLRVLSDACDRVKHIELRFGCTVTDAATHANGVTVQVHRNKVVEEILAIGLIGADGVWSRLHTAVNTVSKPLFSGHIAWRGLVPMDDVPAEIPRKSTGLWLGPNAHIVHYPIRSGTVLNVVAITPWTESNAPAPDWIFQAPGKQRLEPFEEWNDTIQKLIRVRVPWGGWPLHAVREIGRLNHQHICLIGDAAHAMLPYAAQGGASAIEDAAVLAKCCARYADNIADAFDEFWLRRRKRLRKLLVTTEKNRGIYHMSGNWASVRNGVLKYTPQSMLQRRLDWLYGWES